MKIKYNLISLSAPILALSLSVCITSLILIAIGKNPLETFALMYDYGTTGKSLVSIVNRFIPLYISAIAVAVGFKMGLFNIGVEGQYLLSALLAAAIGASFSVSRPVHILLIMIIATVVSSFWGAIAGYLKVNKGIHEVISTIMLNYIGTGIIAYLLGQVFNDEDKANLIPQTTPLPETGQIPELNKMLSIEDLPSLHGFLPTIKTKALQIFILFAQAVLQWLN